MLDKDIVDLYWQRSETAIEKTAEKYGGYCYSIAYNILSQSEDAEECVTDTWIGAWNSMPPHKPSYLSGFLAKITRRISISKWRKKRAEKRGGGEIPLSLEELSECVSDGEDINDEIERRRLAEVLSAFVSSLEKNTRKVFLLRYFYNESIEKISRETGFSETKIKSMLYRARIKLAAVLEKEGFCE